MKPAGAPGRHLKSALPRARAHRPGAYRPPPGQGAGTRARPRCHRQDRAGLADRTARSSPARCLAAMPGIARSRVTPASAYRRRSWRAPARQRQSRAHRDKTALGPANPPSPAGIQQWLIQAAKLRACHLAWQGVRRGSICNCTVMSTAGSSPMVPERWPFLPPVSVQP